MSIRTFMSRRRVRRLVLSTGAVVLTAPLLYAAQYTWNNTTGNWSDALKWLEGAPVSSNDTSLLFGSGPTPYISTDDLAGTFILNNLTLNSTATAAQTIAGASGSTLNFSTNSLGVLPTITQSGTGPFVVNVDMVTGNTVTLGGAGTGLVTLGGVISGTGGLNFATGNWRIGGAANTLGGTTIINTGAAVEIGGNGVDPQSVNFAVAAGGGVLGNSALTINGGKLKLTTVGAGSLALGAARPVIFGAAGGILDLTNNNGVTPTAQGGNIASGDLALTLNNTPAVPGNPGTPGNPAVVRFNGGQLGLSNNSATNADFVLGTNALRFSATGSGPLRLELTNGALMRANNGGGTGDSVFPMSVTIQGVVGGDPTSGPNGTTNTGLTLTTGRVQTDANRINYTGGVTFSGALQYLNANRATAVNGNMTVASNGYIAFQGRGTGQVLAGNLAAVGATAGPANLVLYVGEDANSTLTVQGGGIVDFDGRLRTEQPFAHGILMGANAILNPGGTLRVAQSTSNFSAFAGLTTTQNESDIILKGNITGQGNSTSESLLEIRLPAPLSGATVASGIPQPLAEMTLVAGTGSRPFAGLVADPANRLIVNGTEFGGLKVLASARPNRLFSATGLAGGAAVPDPTPNVVKLDGYLTATRLAAVTGTGGYLNPGASGETWTFPVGGEWNSSVSVGLRVANDNANANATDIVMGPSTWGHNIAVSAGATLDTGTNAFTMTAGRLEGVGNLIGAGGLTVASGATVAPGLAGIGTLTVGNITLGGTLELQTTNTASVDQLAVLGNLTLSAGSTLLLPATNTFGNQDITIATFTGTRTGTFTNVTGLPANFAVDYTANTIRLLFSTITDIWNGVPNGNWDKTTPNWKGSVLFADFHKVLFDDTAVGTKNVTITGGNVIANLTTVNTAGTYSITATTGNALTGTGPLVKEGSGTLILTGPHSYSGGTQVNGGTLRAGANDSLPDVGTILVAPGAVLDTNGKTDTVDGLTVNGSLIGGGTLTANSTTLGAGVTGALAQLTTTALALDNGATLTATTTKLKGDVTKTGTGAGAVINGAIDLGGPVRNFIVAAGSGTDLTINGNISSGGLTKAGLGILQLGGVNNYNGPTTVNGGTLRAGAATALPATSDLVLGTGGTLDSNGFNLAVGALSGAGNITLSGTPGLLTTTTAAASTFSGSISGTGLLQKAGTGVLTLTGASLHGGTTITGGTIRSGNTNALGAAGSVTTVKTGGVLVLTVSNQAQSITLDGGILSGSNLANNINIFNGDLTIANTSGTASTIELFDHGTPATRSEMFFTTLMHGTGDLNIIADASVAGADGGPGFRPSNIAVAPDYSGNITLGQRAKIDLRGPGGAVQFSSAGTGAIRLTAGTVTGLNGTYSQINVRADHSNFYGNNIEVLGTGSVNLTPVNLGVGDANVEHTFGDLKIANQQRIMVNKNRVDYTLFFPTAHLQGGVAEFSPNDPIAAVGGGALRFGAITESVPGSGWSMEGLGRVTLSGDSTYTGATTINNGTVIVNGSISGTSGLAVKNGTLGGSGTINAPVLLGDGDGLDQSALLIPGGTAAVGTLTTGALTLARDGAFTLELDSNTLTSDRVVVNGQLQLGLSSTLSLSDLGSTLLAGYQSFTLATASGGISGQFLGMPENVPLNINGSDYNLHYLPNSIVLQAVPEPGALVSFASGLALLCGWHRRRRA